MSRVFHALIAASATAFSVGCTPDTSPEITSPIIFAPRIKLSAAARSNDSRDLLVQAAQGKKVRGEQDEMLKLEAKLPGFGGFFRDSTGQVITYLKRNSSVARTLLRAELTAAYSARPEQLVREAMVTASNATILDADFSLSELIAYENRINYSSTPVPGYVGCGVSIRKNRVLLGLERREDVEKAIQHVTSLGVPREALAVEVWGKFEAATTWDSDVRPVRGGMKIGVMNRSTYPWGTYLGYVGIGSAGFNVRTSWGTTYLMLSSHVINTAFASNGHTGDTITQSAPKFDGVNWKIKPIGVTVLNPLWTVGPLNCNKAGTDYCTTSDVALMGYAFGVSGERKIATSVYEASNGLRGSDEINGYHSISAVLPPDLVVGGSAGVHKSGYRSGTTTGTLEAGLITIDVTLCWGPSTAGADQPCAPTRNFRYIDVTLVRGALTLNGDSGGPVFAGNGSPYAALGMVVGRGGELDAQRTRCLNADLCFTFFHKWSALESGLGIGPLTPTTN